MPILDTKTITVERPMRDEEGNVAGQRGKAKGKPQADSSLRDYRECPTSQKRSSDYFRERFLRMFQML